MNLSQGIIILFLWIKILKIAKYKSFSQEAGEPRKKEVYIRLIKVPMYFTISFKDGKVGHNPTLSSYVQSPHKSDFWWIRSINTTAKPTKLTQDLVLNYFW